MSDASNVDDNNNDGTRACRVTSFINCCDPKKSSTLQPCVSSSKELLQFNFSKETSNSFDTFRACDNLVSTTASNLLNGNIKCENNTSLQKFAYSIHQSSNKDSDESSSEKENKLNGDRPETPKSAPITIFQKAFPRGILKYPPGWRRRAISESSALICSSSSTSDDNSFFGTSLDSPDILFEFDDDCIEDSLEKPKKNVTFSEKMATTLVFRPNSSILGRRLKNQKKAKKKKEKKLFDSLEKLNSDNDVDNSVEFKDQVLAAKHFIAAQRMSIDCYDNSSTDVSSSSGCDTSASECSGDEIAPSEVINNYEDESKTKGSQTKRKNRRKNRKNKQNVRTRLETGGYDSD